jgi:hypothetical protein
MKFALRMYGGLEVLLHYTPLYMVMSIQIYALNGALLRSSPIFVGKLKKRQ